MSARYQRRAMQDSARYQHPRDVVHSQLFWLKMAVGFNGTANQALTAYTEAEGFDCLVRGAWSDLAHAKVRMSTTEEYTQRMSQQIPLRALIGNSTEVNPIVWWRIPWFIEARNTIQADWLNPGSESAGTVCFYVEKQAMYDHAGNLISIGDSSIKVKRSIMFYLFLDLSKTTDTTLAINNDCLIWGATTNIESSAIVGRLTNETTNYSWSSTSIPIQAMAGQDGQPQPILRYAHPYLLPANVSLRVNLDAAAASGSYLAFECERIYE